MNNIFTAITRRRWLALAAGSAATVAAPASAVRGGTPQPQPWPQHRPQPTLVLPSLDGEPWKLSEQASHAVLLNFWASWCEPCRAEMPALQRLAARHAPSELHVMAVNFRESPDVVRRYMASAGVNLPVLMDADGSVARALDIHVFPTTVAIDRRGRIRFTVTGECAWDVEPATRWLRALN